MNNQSEMRYNADTDDSDEDDLEELVLGKKNISPEETNNNFFIDKTAASGGYEEPSSAWFDDDDVDHTEISQRKRPMAMRNLQHQPLMKANRKSEFEKTVGEAPAWSVLPMKNSVDETEELLTNNFTYVETSESLPKGVVSITKCTDMNHQQPSANGIESCEFHKTAQIALTAANDCRLNLFQVDGKSNPKIHSFFTENFPIKCAHFLTNGEEILITSRFRWFYSYDMISGNVNRYSSIKGVDDIKLGNFKVSPDGKYIVFISSYGQLHLVSSKTKELISTIKMNGIVADVAFAKNGQQLLTFGDEGMVNLWDVRSQRCVHNFADEGCTNGTSLAVSPNGKYIACGSTSGIVNMYDETCYTNGSPQPIKTFKNLQTSVSSLIFNAQSEILAMASSSIENAVKLIHVRSMTVFSNFPGFKNKILRFPRILDFSPNSGYFTVGNHKGHALLYRLDHYTSF